MTETGKSPLNIAVIGCGRIAGHHCRSIAAAEGAQIVALCDLESKKAQVFAEEHQVGWYANYRDMFVAHPEIDIVVIATPSGMHCEHAIDVIEGYGKHVVVEKPTFMHPTQADAAFDAAERAGVKLFPVFQNRYNKAVDRVRHALSAGELGEIRVMAVRLRWCRPQRYYDLAPWRGTFSHDGGALTNQGIHHVDLLRHLGGDVQQVNATMRTLGAEIEAEDTVVATFTFESGAVGSLEVTTSARPDDFEASVSIVGSKGLAQLGGIAVNELQIFTPDPDACAENSVDFVGIEGHGAVYGYGHYDMYRDVVACLKDQVPYPVSRQDSIATLRLLHGFYRSDEVGGWVTVGPGGESERLGRANEAISDLYRTPTVAASEACS
ncbi:MAG: Gfo/Idh/MocA family oxidoreductase [Rhodospirillaceae bacterium]|jgi:predicted dehydrogenase|nr:Gfo/Idh/MocA family oxidoreductase [Rhodospirillaceae bacterium]MBT5459378.1 Gfo/Idh/MocA family oxidoreductase [Rhodospirillaceae bacterium]